MSGRLARLGLALALITGVVAAAATPVAAETSISVTPAIVDLTGEAGSRGRIPITITNRGDEPFSVATSVATYEDLTGDRSAVEWIRVRPDRIDIKPGESRDATLVVRIPQDIVSGGRYALVNLSTLPPEGEDVATIAGRIAIPVLLAARGEGPLVGDLVLERFASFVEADGRLGFRAMIRNDGNVHTRVAGNVEVGRPTSTADPSSSEDLSSGDPASSDIAGGEVVVQTLASLDFPERTILPGVSRVLIGHGTLPLASEGELSSAAVFRSVDPDDRDASPSLMFDGAFATRSRLALRSATVCENLDGGPTFSGIVANDGEVGVSPHVRFEVTDAGGTLISSATPTAPVVDVWPGDEVALDVALDRRLLSGSYILRVTASHGPDAEIELSIPFGIGGDPATAAPVCAVGDAEPDAPPG